MKSVDISDKKTKEDYVINCDADPFVPDGWKVEEHQKGGQFKWDASKVKLYLSKKQNGSSYIEGNKLREELKGQSVYNANLLDYLLKNPHLIPEEWKGKATRCTSTSAIRFAHVFFWGTVYRNPGGGGYPCVRCLCWDGDGWGWSHHGLTAAARFHRGPAAVPAS